MSAHRPATRTLRDHPDLDQLKRQAKELLRAFHAGKPDAIADVQAHFRVTDASSFALHDAQLVLARAHGFDSWPKFKAFVNGVTVAHLIDAVRADDLTTVDAMLTARPELVGFDASEGDEHRALHYAVLEHHPQIVRVLMRHGADARKGIWPHRDATSALTLAIDRGDTEIAAIIREEELRRLPRGPLSALPSTATDQLLAAFRTGNEDAMITFLATQPEFVQRTDGSGRTALHWAAACVWPKLASWLVDHGADVHAVSNDGRTVIDVLGEECRESPQTQSIVNLVKTLLKRGAVTTARAAVATRDANWLRQHARGSSSHNENLVSWAVTLNHLDILELLLDLNFDPDERGRIDGVEEDVPSWGRPLRIAAIARNHDAAAMLLKHGASPDTNVYAASSAFFEAYRHRDTRMIDLLDRHGGGVDAMTAGWFGLVDRAKALIDAEAAGRLRGGAVTGERSVADALLDAGAGNGHIDIVALALEHLDWPPGHERWSWMLMQPLGGHGAADRERFVACFRSILNRSGVPRALGRTLLHDLAGDWPRSKPMAAADRLAFATVLLDAGARIDVRDDMLQSTPLGWACRWGQTELVQLLLERGADPIEKEAPPWATPLAWARTRAHERIVALLERAIG
jgi:ankyrin repeat protein